MMMMKPPSGCPVRFSKKNRRTVVNGRGLVSGILGELWPCWVWTRPPSLELVGSHTAVAIQLAQIAGFWHFSINKSFIESSQLQTVIAANLVANWTLRHATL